MKYVKKHFLQFVLLLILLAVLIFITFGSKLIIKRFLPIKYEEEVTFFSEKYSVDKFLIFSMISCESSFNESAESQVGATGLMQLMPETADWLNREYSLGFSEIDLKDAKTNIELGCVYVRYLKNLFGDDLTLLAASYNAGQGNVASWLEKYSSDGVHLEKIPYKETSKYVKKVLARYEIYKKVYS